MLLPHFTEEENRDPSSLSLLRVIWLCKAGQGSEPSGLTTQPGLDPLARATSWPQPYHRRGVADAGCSACPNTICSPFSAKAPLLLFGGPPIPHSQSWGPHGTCFVEGAGAGAAQDGAMPCAQCRPRGPEGRTQQTLRDPSPSYLTPPQQPGLSSLSIRTPGLKAEADPSL